MRHKFLTVFVVLFAVHCHAQVITSLTPNSGTPGETRDVVIRGVNTHFKNGVSVASFGEGIVVQKFAVSNTLTGTATIHIDNNAVTGFRTVQVQTGNEVAGLENEFEVFPGSGMLRANIELMPIETVSLSDLDLTVPKNSPILFFVNIYNDNTTRNIKTYVSLSSASRGYIGKMSMNSRTLNPNQNVRFTNRDFNDVNLNSITGRQFLDIVKVLGTFPPDDYTYKLEVTDEEGNIIASDEDVNVVTNLKSNPELILPGNTFNNPVESVFTPFPLFQWFGQMNSYDFALYEVRPGQTPEEAVRNIAVFKKTDITATSFLYPNYAEKLIPGKIYAWQILGKLVSSKGTQYMPSEVFRFAYGSPTETPDPKTIMRIEIIPPEITISANQQVQFKALCFDQDGNILSNAVPQWSVTPAGKGAINANGLFTAGLEPGTIAVIAKAGSNNASEFAIVKVQMPITDSGPWMHGLLRQLFGVTEDQ